MFCDSLRDFLAQHSSPGQIRALWESETGRDPGMLRGLAELGLPGMLTPAAQGGLGLRETDCVLLAEECGFAALPEPIMDTVLLTAPLLAELGGALAEQYLPGLLAGELRVALGAPGAPCIADAGLAALALLSDGESAEKIYALPLQDAALLDNEPALAPSYALPAGQVMLNPCSLVDRPWAEDAVRRRLSAWLAGGGEP